MAQEPIVELWVLVRRRPGIVAGFRIDGEFHVSAGRLEGLGYGDFLRPKCVTPLEASEAVRVPACHYTAASWRTNRMSGVESVETQSTGRHCIEVWRLEDRVSVIRHITPALVIGHTENNIRFC